MAAAQRGGGATGIDRRFLLAAGAQLPQIADREADRRQTGGAVSPILNEVGRIGSLRR